MKTKPLVIAAFIFGVACGFLLAAILGLIKQPEAAGNSRSFTFRSYIDGCDVIRVSGGKLWIEPREWELPGDTYVNGKAWKPAWKDKMSAPYDGLGSSFTPADFTTVKVAKQLGRGQVTVEQMPTVENNGTLAVKIDDNDFAGADWYEFVVSW